MKVLASGQQGGAAVLTDLTDRSKRSCANVSD